MSNPSSSKGCKALFENNPFQTFARCLAEQSEQNNLPAHDSHLQATPGPEAQSTASFYKVNPTDPLKCLNGEASSCPDLRSEPDSLSVSGFGSDSGLLDSSHSPPGVVASALPDWQEDREIGPVMPREATHVGMPAQQSIAPDPQVGDVNVTRAPPSTGQVPQPDRGVQHLEPRQVINERDQKCINVEDRTRFGQGEAPWIVRKPSEAQYAEKPSFKSAP